MDNQRMEPSSKFSSFIQEILSVSISGTYISNLKLHKISEELGLECTLKSSEHLLGDMFQKSKQNGCFASFVEALLQLFTQRRREYEKLAGDFATASLFLLMLGKKASVIEQKLRVLAAEERGGENE
jgi:hypothetical protein